MGRKKKSDIQSGVLYDGASGVDSEFRSEFSSSDYSNISNDVEFKSPSELFDYWLNFSEPSREFTKVEHKGINKLVRPLGKMPSGKYVLITKSGETFITSEENIKLI